MFNLHSMLGITLLRQVLNCCKYGETQNTKRPSEAQSKVNVNIETLFSHRQVFYLSFT